MSKHTATYSPEDNKLRLYIGRVPREEYLKLKAEGWKALHKQREAGHGDFVATWTPDREDTALSYCEEGEDIGDEDYSPEERAADRAERFSGYRDKRASEAGESADTFEAGPSAFGHQNRHRAERQAARHDRHRGRALTQWAKAEYWQERTAGVIAHALHKSSPETRRGRILTLEAEQRKHEKSREEFAKRYRGWESVLTLDGADELLPLEGDRKEWKPAQRLAYALANSGSCWTHFYHPTCEAANEKAREIWKHGFSTYDLLTNTEFIGQPFERLTPRQVAELWLSKMRKPDCTECHSYRWSQHYIMRLSYENAMLENEGGKAADVEMEVGGWIGNHQIHKVNKSNTTGRVVSVTLKCKGDRWGRTNEGYHFQAINIERMGQAVYRAPTDAERQEFAIETKQRKAAEKAKKPPTGSLVNPTDADAERLQALWNAAGQAAHDRNASKYSEPFKPSDVLRMTQAQYSQNSGGSYSPCETAEVSEKLTIRSRRGGGRVCVFKIRTASASNSQWNSARRVIILTDKPQKPIPWEAVEKARAKQPTEDDVFPTLLELSQVLASYEKRNTEEGRKLIADAAYVGWCYGGHTQEGFTDEGRKAFARFMDIKREGGTPTKTGVFYESKAVAAARESTPAQEETAPAYQDAAQSLGEPVPAGLLF